MGACVFALALGGVTRAHKAESEPADAGLACSVPEGLSASVTELRVTGVKCPAAREAVRGFLFGTPGAWSPGSASKLGPALERRGGGRIVMVTREQP